MSNYMSKVRWENFLVDTGRKNIKNIINLNNQHRTK